MAYNIYFIFRNQHLTTKEAKSGSDFMILNMSYLGQMTNLTEIKLKGVSGIKIVSMPSLENLINLKTFVS